MARSGPTSDSPSGRPIRLVVIEPSAILSAGVREVLDEAPGIEVVGYAATAGEAASLVGFPVVEAEDMPDIAANALSFAFGDFRAGYLVVDRTDVRVLRDPYSAKPYVLFYTTKRVGGGVQNFEAIKLIRFAVS